MAIDGDNMVTKAQHNLNLILYGIKLERVVKFDL